MADADNTVDPGIESDGLDLSPLQRFIGYRITRLELHLHRRLVERISEYSLRPVEFSILLLVSANHGINQRQLGSALEISPPNLVAVINRLIAKRLLRRIRSRSDRRVQQLHLTPSGSALLEKAEAEVARHEAKLAGTLTATELRTLQNVIAKLTRA